MEFADRELTCIDCGQPFVFTAGEQEFHASKGFKEEPKHCKVCRDTRKARRGGEGAGSERAAPEATDPRVPRGLRDTVRMRPARELYDATCATCQKATKVPFRPVAGRPVYCKDCFNSRKGTGG